MLQYIVSGSNAQEIISTATSALANGCRWIRLDLSELAPVEIEATVKTLQEKCSSLEAFLTIDNDIETTTSLKVAGVHLGLDRSATAVEARKHLGEETIMGITVADAAQVPFVPHTAIDYIAVASDDLDTCHKVMEQTRAAGLEEPVIAPFAHATPIASLMATGVNGIAAHHTTTPPAMIPQLLKELNTLLEQRLKELD